MYTPVNLWGFSMDKFLEVVFLGQKDCMHFNFDTYNKWLSKGLHQFALLPRGCERAHCIAQNLKVLNQTGLMNTSEAIRKNTENTYVSIMNMPILLD